MIDTNIQKNLTEDEKELFGLIREFILSEKPDNVAYKGFPSDIEAYAVGGWVRDKMLGMESDDIDIMIDKLDGLYFASAFSAFLQRRKGDYSQPTEKVHWIEENPEKSKHISTAKMHVPLSSGKIQEVDFAQARKDVYNENSRIPESLESATPEEDAYRRDLTINAIFYDIMGNEVKDFTGKGIQDLITKTIRTPEEPFQTFHDDPLRMFRTIRFAAKYDGQIDPETFKALSDPKLLDRLEIQAKDRIGKEIVKMLQNPNPEVAVKLLKESGLWQHLINEALRGTRYEGKMRDLEMSQNNPHHELSVWGHTYQTVLNSLQQFIDDPEDKKVVAILSALFHDIGKLYEPIETPSKSHPGRSSYKGHELESSIIAPYVMKYLQLSNNTIKQVSDLVKSHMRLHQFTEGEGSKASAKAFRKFIRQMGEQGLDWIDVFKLSVADAYSKGMDVDPKVAKKYEALKVKLDEALNSMNVSPEQSAAKPILNGNEIMAMFPNRTAGAWISEITEYLLDLQDDNPNLTKEEAAQLIQNNFGEQTVTEAQEAHNSNKYNSPTPSKFLIDQKRKDIEKAIKEKEYHKAITVLNELVDDYDSCEDVIRMAAKVCFTLIAKDKEKYRHNDLLDQIFKKAELEFFDSYLCSYVTGILLIINTSTEDKIIEEIGHRMVKMNPELLHKVLSQLPEEIDRPEIKNKLKKELDENN